MAVPLLAGGAALEEVLVTAQKREKFQSTVPLSLQVAGVAELESAHVTGVAGLRERIPGLLAIPHPNADTTLGVYLRGVGNPDEQVIQDPSVGIYLDGIYLPRSQALGIDIADLSRIEVVKGPQGTLYGRNASGGAINFISAIPGSSPWRVTQQLSTGSRDFRRVRTRVDLGSSETIALAATYLETSEDGFVRNAGTGASHFGSRDRKAANVDLLWHPAQDWSLRLKLDQQEHGDSPAFIGRVPAVSVQTARPKSGHPSVVDLRPNSARSRGIVLIGEHDLNERSSLRYLASRRELNDSQYQNYHSGVVRPGPVLVTLAAGAHVQYSHELQWLGQSGNRNLEYVLGLYWSRETALRESENRLMLAGSSRLVFGRDAESKSRAVFGNVTWRLASLDERLRLQVGGRYTEDERLAVLERATRNLASATVVFNPVLNRGMRSFSDFTPSAALMVDVNDGLMSYLRFEEGYKSGGFNARASSAQRFAEGFDEEQLRSWEFGVKAELPALNSRLHAAVFNTRYDQIQLEVRSNPVDYTVSDVLNAGDAVLRGIEFEFTSKPLPYLTTRVSYSGLQARYAEVRNADGRNLADSYRFVGAPRHAAQVSADLALGTVYAGNLAARVEYGWQDRFDSSSTLAAGAYSIAPYGILNASLQQVWKSPRGEVAVRLWARNLADKHYYLAHFNGGTGLVLPSAIWGAPRTAGVDIEYRL